MHPLYSIVQRRFIASALGKYFRSFTVKELRVLLLAVKWVTNTNCCAETCSGGVGAKSVVASSKKGKRRFLQSRAITL